MKKVIIGFLFFLLIFLFGCSYERDDLNEITITSMPNKVVYFLDEELDLNGLTVTAIYEKHQEIVIDYEVYGFDSSTIGKKEIFIRYKDLETKIIVEVIKKEEPEEQRQLTGIEIVKEPEKLIYYPEEELDLAGLEIVADYSDDSKETIVELYDVIRIQDGKRQRVVISYKEFTCYFYIDIIEKEELITNLTDEYGRELIMFSEYDAYITNVLYGGSRQKNQIIYYDEYNNIKTNIYGYEFAINKYGVVIEEGINVSMPKGGTRISAHGEGVATIKNSISIGDIIYYDSSIESLFIYKDIKAGYITNIEGMVEDARTKVESISDTKTYNNYTEKLNLAILSYNQLVSYINVNNLDCITLEVLEKECKEIEDMLSFTLNLDFVAEEIDKPTLQLEIKKELNFTELSTISQTIKNSKILIEKINDIRSGGFRAYNEIVHYDETNWYQTNNSGYEIAVDNSGRVVDLAINVQVPQGGFIISGQYQSGTYLKELVSLGDYIE